jgi:hypothetical protein
MEQRPSVLKIVGIIAAVLLLGLVAGWYGTRGAAGKNPAPVLPVASPMDGGPAREPASATPAAAMSNAIPPMPAGMEAVEAPPDSVFSTNWENRVDKILGSTVPESDKAKEMLAMFPNLPEEAKAEVAQHLANLTPDQDFPALKPLLTNSTLPEVVMDVLMAGLLNRPNSLKLPLLLEIARTEGHPKAGEAKDMLTIFLQEDDGKDWGKWDNRMQQWLKDNPD